MLYNTYHNFINKNKCIIFYYTYRVRVILIYKYIIVYNIYYMKLISTRAYIVVSVKAVCFYPNKLRLLHGVLLDLCDS